MLKKVIVGHDGRAGGDDALALARVLAPDAELVLANAYPYDAQPSRAALLGFANALRDDALEALHHVRDAANLPQARTVVVADTVPARGLHRLADDEHADLLVLGSAHHGALGRMLLGDVSRAALHGSPCPVAVAPRGFSVGQLATIGVACNNEPEAKLAVKVAAELAAGLDARLVVRDVVESDLWPAFGGYPVAINLDEVLEEVREGAQQRLEETCAGLPGQIEPSAVVGSTAEKLNALAGEVDLLVCGSRGWGAIRRTVLGSTADRLIHQAPCPVLVVPRTATVVEPDIPVEAATGALDQPH
ncbi:MAG TPA: universal stress protein [Baekduia sp.]|nr:universal stress protein [Baekduia sp.]